jgi:hypothetical protein
VESVNETFASFVAQVAKDPDVSVGFSEAYRSLPTAEREQLVSHLAEIPHAEPMAVYAPLFAVEEDPVLRAHLFQRMGPGLSRTAEAYADGEHAVILAENLYEDWLAGTRVVLQGGVRCERVPLVRRKALNMAPLLLSDAIDRIASALVRAVHTHKQAPPEELAYYAYLFGAA